MEEKKAILIILDGWGYGNKDASDAAYQANTPFFDSLLATYPNSRLAASGEAVGLPEGQMGNSEVGHMNLGAGRIVYQELGKIAKSIKDNELQTHPVLIDAFDYAKANNKNVHFIGLVSNGGVHSHLEHLKALCDAAKNNAITPYIHAFTDGRDTDPNSGLMFLTDLQNHLTHSAGVIASVVGRYYAMDRDRRWERVKIAYDLMVHGVGKPTMDIMESVRNSYQDGLTDEFIMPLVSVDAENKPLGNIQPGDVVLCFNFRTDRGREITAALCQEDFHEQNMHKLPLRYITMTNYDDTFQNVDVIFRKEDLVETMGEVLEKNNKTQVRIAETEKYPHVTFFFSGGRENEFIGEKRLMVPSPKVATYDLQPEMSAPGITDAITREIEDNHPDFVCLNFANPDMVGHTGVFEAVVKAVETVDHCLQRVVECGLKYGYSFIILADHGNSDYMINADGSPNTAHTTNLVPCIMIDKDFQLINDGKLGDIAPTLLKMMKIEVPSIMTGNILVG